MTEIVILTGAGISADSGVSTFRDAEGLWAKYDLREVATPEGFATNPALVHKFYNLRRAGLSEVEPNPAHFALAKLEQNRNTFLITQNVDDLHTRAGSQNMLQMHGALDRVICTHCQKRQHWRDDLFETTPCPACAKSGGMRPDIVWFGEIPRGMNEIEEALSSCKIFISIGTSGTVYPAAGLVAQAKHYGAHTMEINLEPGDQASLFDEKIYGAAKDTVPAFVGKLLET